VSHDHHRLVGGGVVGLAGVQLLGDQAGVVGPGQFRPVDRQLHQQRPLAEAAQLLHQPRVGGRAGHAAVDDGEQGHWRSFLQALPPRQERLVGRDAASASFLAGLAVAMSDLHQP
jgi:hypothetical protein